MFLFDIILNGEVQNDLGVVSNERKISLFDLPLLFCRYCCIAAVVLLRIM